MNTSIHQIFPYNLNQLLIRKNGSFEVVSAWLASSIILRRHYFDRLFKKLPTNAEVCH